MYMGGATVEAGGFLGPQYNDGMAIKIMLETNVLKFAATKLERLVPRGNVGGVPIYEHRYINPNDAITNPDLKTEAELLPRIAELAKRRDLELLLDDEANLESWGVKNMDSAGGLFFDAPIKDAEPPLSYERILFGGGVSARERVKRFLIGINDKRFIELSKVLGGYQGSNNYNLNQLRDAYYVWSAEHNSCEYMLTMDFKLIKMIQLDRKQRVKVRVVRPSELLEEVGRRIVREAD